MVRLRCRLSIPGSSGRTDRHRLHRGGDRDANRPLAHQQSPRICSHSYSISREAVSATAFDSGCEQRPREHNHPSWDQRRAIHGQ
ncbi:hypothetical protein D7193_12055 [Micromonospora costi]|uniref:Uncharacterized protein n=1 Tax=Micromonospora costi TaxID=1530042 RepID=A0A3B0A4L6_9ACTN|nr:hypothetical protein D7193_12055 [Micromonospora costi]